MMSGRPTGWVERVRDHWKPPAEPVKDTLGQLLVFWWTNGSWFCRRCNYWLHLLDVMHWSFRKTLPEGEKTRILLWAPSRYGSAQHQRGLVSWSWMYFKWFKERGFHKMDMGCLWVLPGYCMIVWYCLYVLHGVSCARMATWCQALQGIKTSNWKRSLEWLERAPEAVVICNSSFNELQTSLLETGKPLISRCCEDVWIQRWDLVSCLQSLILRYVWRWNIQVIR